MGGESDLKILGFFKYKSFKLRVVGVRGVFNITTSNRFLSSVTFFLILQIIYIISL